MRTHTGRGIREQKDPTNRLGKHGGTERVKSSARSLQMCKADTLGVSLNNGLIPWHNYVLGKDNRRLFVC